VIWRSTGRTYARSAEAPGTKRRDVVIGHSVAEFVRLSEGLSGMLSVSLSRKTAATAGYRLLSPIRRESVFPLIEE
jgi:hypothetical protein